MAPFFGLLSLNLLIVVAACAIVVRLPLAARHERVYAAATLWNVLLLVPVHGLGVINHLTRPLLAATSVLLSAAIIVATAPGLRVEAHAGVIGKELKSWLVAPRDLLKRSMAHGVIGLAAMAIFAFALFWSLRLVWLYPSEGWDGVWYHDTMVGYAIQQHGYATIELPMLNDAALIQQANGYPRSCEMTGLWFVIFTDRRLLELPNTIAVIPLALGTYAFCRRYGSGDRAIPLIWAVAMILLPGVRLQMRTTYVDNQVAAFNVAAFYFATHPKLNAKLGLVAASALALALGGKSMALLLVPPLAFVALVIVAYNEGRKRIAAIALSGVGSAAIIVLFGGFTYLLNWTRYDNPFYPVALPFLGKTYPGPVRYDWVNVNRTAGEVLDQVLALPAPGSDYADIKTSGYGLAVGYLLVGTAAIALALAVAVVVYRALVRATKVAPFGEDGAIALNLVVCCAIAIFTLYKSPALWAARYNVHGVVVGIAATHWLSYRFAKRDALATGGATLMLVTNVMMWNWSKPGWQYDTAQIEAMERSTVTERAATSLLLVKNTALARERELGPGAVVVWSEDMPFPSLLWNEHFSNRLVYVPTGNGVSYVDAAEERDATWIVIGAGNPAMTVVRGRSDRWQEVGSVHAHPQQPCTAFRRIR